MSYKWRYDRLQSVIFVSTIVMDKNLVECYWDSMFDQRMISRLILGECVLLGIPSEGVCWILYIWNLFDEIITVE